MADTPRIILDGSSVVGPRTGIGYATAEILNFLGALWPEGWPPAKLYINSPRHPLPEEDAWRSSPAFEVKHTRYSGRALMRGWQWFGWPPLERLTGCNADLIHAPASYIPPHGRARRVVTVHDVYFNYSLDHVEAYGGRYFYDTFRRKLHTVDHIIAISEWTREEMLRHYDLDPNRITVVNHAVNHERFNTEPIGDETTLLRRLGIDASYFCAVATLEPRKNLLGLIDAYELYARQSGSDFSTLPRLLLVGNPGWGTAQLQARIARSPVRELIQTTGYLESQYLPVIYRGALAMVLPSFYEGFGMPVLEAMACGCPCLLSDKPSLPEIGGEAAIYSDPNDAQALATQLACLNENPALRNDLRSRGLTRSQSFTWERTARETLDVYIKVLS